MTKLGRALEEIERPKAKERQGRPDQPRSENFTEHTKGDTRDIVGEAVGTSTLRDAEEAVERALAARGPVAGAMARLRAATEQDGRVAAARPNTTKEAGRCSKRST